MKTNSTCTDFQLTQVKNSTWLDYPSSLVNISQVHDKGSISIGLMRLTSTASLTNDEGLERKIAAMSKANKAWIKGQRNLYAEIY